MAFLPPKFIPARGGNSPVNFLCVELKRCLDQGVWGSRGVATSVPVVLLF